MIDLTIITNAVVSSFEKFNPLILAIFSFLGGGLVVYNKQKKCEERNSLDLLLASVNRYLHHVLYLRRHLLLRTKLLQNYILNPNDEINFDQAFCTMSVVPNFEVDVTKYDFTISTKPCIVDDIMLYQQTYKGIEKGFEFLNDISRNNADFEKPKETTLLAHKLLSPNWHIHTLLIYIAKAAYLLNRILNKVNEYKILYKHRFKYSLGMQMSEDTKKEMNEIILFLKSLDDQTWKECINDLEPKDFRYCAKRFLRRVISFTNEGNHKKICFLGLKIKFRRTKQEKNDAKQEIYKILQEHSDNLKQIRKNIDTLALPIGIMFEEITKGKKAKVKTNSKSKSKKSKTE